MTDQGDEPTRLNVPAVGPDDEPTRVGMPPVLPGGDGQPPYQPPRASRGGPPDRRPWIIAGLMAAIALVAVLLLVLAGDDDDDDVAGDATTTAPTTLESTTTTDATTTTTEATTTTLPSDTAVPPVTADPEQCDDAGSNPLDPDPAAQAVFQAWERGDEACAQLLMTDDAFDELFARDGSGATDVFQGCEEQADPEPYVDCAFTYEGGATHYLMRFSPLAGWTVYDITQVAD